MDADLVHQLIEAITQEYSRRNSKNKKYSYRAYARYLGLDASHLLKFLRGKKGLSRDRLLLIGKKLNLATDWLHQVQISSERVKKPRELFKVIVESNIPQTYHWHYDAVSVLPLLRGFQPTPEWIAKKLGISKDEALEALHALQANGMIMKFPSGMKEKNLLGQPVSLSTYQPGKTSHQRRENQKQYLRKAIEALDEIPIENREQTTMIMAINAKNLPKARLLSQKFRRDMSRLLKKGEDCSEIYALTVGLFPLTKPT